MESTPENLQDPALFLAVEDLELAARGIVEGTMLGVHRSPFTGLSSEFETHREYRPGDDLRHVNWKLWARTDQMFLKLYRHDTNLQLHLALDVSGSMGTAHGPSRKLAWSARAAAALAFLALSRRDAAGVSLLRGAVIQHVPPRVAGGQLQRILATLSSEAAQGQADSPAGLDEVLHLCARRGMVVYFGDLLDGEDGVLRALSVLRHCGHEVAVFHVLDPWELALPERGHFKFTDLETGADLRASCAQVRGRYGQIVARWREDIHARCESEGIAYSLCPTDRPIVEALLGFLGERSRS